MVELAGPDEVRGALERARAAGEALRAMGLEARVALLGAWLDRLRDAAGPVRSTLEAELPAATGFSAQTVRAGLDHALAEFTPRALEELVHDELGAPRKPSRRVALGFDVTAQILAGVLPSPTVVSLLAPLALGSPVVVKPSAHDPVTPRLLAASLGALDPRLRDAVEIVCFPGSDTDCVAALCRAACVVATGSDESVSAVATHVLPPQRFVGYGHRFSVAVAWAGAVSPDSLACALAHDVAHWDQLGCLSPVALYWVGAEEVPAELVGAIAGALAEQEAKMPRGQVPLAAAATFARERDEAELRAAAGAAVQVRDGRSWCVVAEPDTVARPAPLHRFLRIHPVANLPALEAALDPVSAHLAAIGVAPAASAEARAAFVRLGASRICPIGRMQAPPLGWAHDGRGVLLPLARLVDLEVG